MNTTLITQSLDAIEECFFSHVAGYDPTCMRHRRADNAARTIARAATMARAEPEEPSERVKYLREQRAHWRKVMRLQEEGSNKQWDFGRGPRPPA